MNGDLINHFLAAEAIGRTLIMGEGSSRIVYANVGMIGKRWVMRDYGHCELGA